MVKKARNLALARRHIDVACVIHSDGYSWEYVERLYNSVCRNLSLPVQFHVYTEHDRSVPPHMIKHCLEEWPGVKGPKKSWWYKMQLFNAQHHPGDLMYLDLDVVIVNDLSWIVQQPANYLWTLRDFRYLQKGSHSGMNSSLMWWNVAEFDWVWQKFNTAGRQDIIKRYHGDQDYINVIVDHTRKRFYPEQHAASYRWQAHDGGMNWHTRKQKSPGAGTQFAGDTSLLIFHGRPKPHEVDDPVVHRHWI